MPPNRPHLSITLPRNFTFHYDQTRHDTPPGEESGPSVAPQEVPTGPTGPPGPSAPPLFRLRTRRRAPLPSSYHPPYRPAVTASTWTDPDVPRPSIETTTSNITAESESTMMDTRPAPGPLALPLPAPGFEQAQGLLSPWHGVASMAMAGHTAARRSRSPPRTPAPLLDDEASGPRPTRDWKPSTPAPEAPSDTSGISRPTSACSALSDSSASSSNTLSSFPSSATGGSCTSPESDAPDPFSFTKGKSSVTSMPLKHHRHRTGTWTDEMDAHLWHTYLLYLQDPTVTPFRTSGSGAPPLGVCCRVAREAKRSWRPRRTGLLGNQDETQTTQASQTDRERSGSLTPTGTKKPLPRWAGSESTTRKRLRELCRRKSNPSSLRRRFLHSRSPTPFTMNPNTGNGTRRSTLSTSSWRDVGVSLTTETSATMQPNGPLARLQSEPNNAASTSASTDWFNLHPHQGPVFSSNSSQGPNLAAPPAPPRLRSPFAPHPSPFGTHVPEGSHILAPRAQHPRTRADPFFDLDPDNHLHPSQGGRGGLKSPVRLTASLGYASGSKRRAENANEHGDGDGDDQGHLRSLEAWRPARRRPGLSDLFGGPPERTTTTSFDPFTPSSGRLDPFSLGSESDRRVRCRGFSLGDAAIVGAGTGTGAGTGGTGLAPATSPAPARLGSPFVMPDHPPSGLATSISTPNIPTRRDRGPSISRGGDNVSATGPGGRGGGVGVGWGLPRVHVEECIDENERGD